VQGVIITWPRKRTAASFILSSVKFMTRYDWHVIKVNKLYQC
jgi:hypothetical protein